MYVAQKNVRDNMSVEEKVNQLQKHLNDSGYKQLVCSLDAYIHTVDSCIPVKSTSKINFFPVFLSIIFFIIFCLLRSNLDTLSVILI